MFEEYFDDLCDDCKDGLHYLCHDENCWNCDGCTMATEGIGYDPWDPRHIILYGNNTGGGQVDLRNYFSQ